MHDSPELHDSPEPKAWSEWHAFACAELDLGPEECIEYANLRFVEEQNRAQLRSRGELSGWAAAHGRHGLPPG